MSVELLRLRRGISEQNSRAIERKVRSIMSTHFADLSIHFDVNRATKYIIELVPREDDSVEVFEADTGGTWYNSLEALKTRLTASKTISSYVDMATMLGLTDSEEGQTDSEEDLNDSEEESDDGLFVPEWTQAASSTPPPAAADQYDRDTGYTGLFGRPNTTVVPQGRPAQGPYSVAPFQIKYDASSDDDSDHSTTGGVGGPDSGDDTDDTYFYQSDDSDDTSLDDSDSEDSDDMISDDSDDDAHSDFTLDDDSDDSDDDTQSSAKNRVVDNAEMRTIAGEPETTQQRDLAIQVAKAIAGTSSFTKKDTEDKNGKPKPLSELMRMARVTSLWPVLSEFQKDQYMQTTGVLANDRHYIARNVQFGVPIRKKRPFVQNAQGKIIYV